MGKVVQIGALSEALSDTIKGLKTDTQKGVNKKLRKVLVDSWGDTIEGTPIGIGDTEGKTRGSWFVGTKVTGKLGRKNKTKGRNYVNLTLPKKILGKKLYLYNNSDHINVLEFGGYVKNPKRGTYNKRTKQYEIRSAGGFSKQAPHGMARIGVMRFRRNLKMALR